MSGCEIQVSWSAADDARLREMWPAGVAAMEIVEALDRETTASAVQRRASKLGLHRKSKPRRVAWSAIDIRILCELWAGGSSAAEIGAMLTVKRSGPAVLWKARNIGLARRPTGRPAAVEPADPAPDRLAVKPVRKHRVFSEIETRRIRRFRARGDGEADIARQMRCKPEDVRRALA